MIRNVKGKNRKVFTVGVTLLLTTAMIILLMVGPALATNDGSIIRLFGANRWATSANVALEAYPEGSENVIIARGDDAGDWADGLAGGYLAGVLDAPILLTATNTLSAAVADAIVDLGAQKAYILGGTAAVSAGVEVELEALDLEIVRIFGANREATAAQIADMGEVADNTAFVVQGRAPADSMVAGAAAFAKGYPILLVNRDSVPEVTETAIVDLEITNLIIVGGTGVVSQAVEDELDNIDGVESVTRLSGADREATSVVFAGNQFADSIDFSIVNGRRGLADAIGAAVFGNPILYVQTDAIPAGVEAHLVAGVTCESMIYIFGGTAVISAAVAAELQAIKDAAVCDYTVTFAEQNSLAGVVIQVYSDAERTVEVGDALTTDGIGEATKELSDGAYWYNATLDGYVDLEDGFTVAGAAKTVEFTMPVDKDGLLAAISAANDNKDSVEVSVDGSDVDPAEQWVTQEVMDAYATAIAAAQAVYDDSAATQAEVDAAVTDLAAATDTFDAAKQDGNMEPPLDDADLSSLEVTPGELVPSFDAAVIEYAAAVDYDVEEIAVTATLSDVNASLSIDGEVADSGVAFPVSLGAAGTETEIALVVTAEDTVTQKTYTITVERALEWSDADWDYSQKITISADQVEADLTGFPVYIDLSHFGPDFFADIKADGTDIVITAADGATKLQRELVFIDTAGQEGSLHFKAPFLSGSVDTDFYIYYGNAAASEANDPEVWAGYEAVWHMNSVLPLDSTGNGYDISAGTGEPDVIDGKLGKALDFKGSTTVTLLIEESFGELFSGTEDYTITSWFHHPSGTSPASKRIFNPSADYDINLALRSGPAIRFMVWDGSTGSSLEKAIGADSWQYAAVRYEAGSDMGMSLDAGVFEFLGSAPVLPRSLDEDNVFGAGDITGSYGVYEGLLDEFRIYNGLLSEEWIKTEYNNQNNPGAFYTTTFEMQPLELTILNNPYADIEWDIVNHFKAQFHVHTNQSDGAFDPAEVIAYYYGAGHQILALTDHDNGLPGGGFSTTDAIEEPTWPWNEWIDETPSSINTTPDGMQTSAIYSDLGSREILAVKGNEISRPHHIGSYFNDYGKMDLARDGEREALDEIENRNGLAVLFHPGRYTTEHSGTVPYPEPLSDTWYKELFEYYHHVPLVGLEVYNQGNRHPHDRELWDRINALVMPDITVFGYSNDDMHIESEMHMNYQFMLMNELTEDALRVAMLTGAFYFCYEPGGSGDVNSPVPLIENIEVSEDGTVITILATGADSITWRTDSGEVESEIVGDDEYTIDLKDFYEIVIFIRAELENDYGITHTQPFVLGY